MIKCINCDYFKPFSPYSEHDKTACDGECKKNAPQVVAETYSVQVDYMGKPTNGGYGRMPVDRQETRSRNKTVFPIVESNNGCGDGKIKEVKSLDNNKE